jgi:hypothetical protein
MEPVRRIVTDPEYRLRVTVVAVLAATFLLYFRGEKTLPAEGTGGDGSVYAHLIRSLANRKVDPIYSTHTLKRFAPCWCVAEAMRFFRIEPTFPNIVKFMNLWNWLFVLLGVWAALQIGKGLNLSADGKTLLICLLFVNYAYLKMAAFYPVLWDTTGSTLGLVMMASYLTGRIGLLALSGLAAGLCWPTGLLIACPLLICFPFRDPAAAPTDRDGDLPARIRLTDLLPVLGLLVYLGYVLLNGERWANLDRTMAELRIVPREKDLLILSILSVVVTSFLGVALLWRPLVHRLKGLRLRPMVPGLVLSLILFAIHRCINGLVVASYSDGSSHLDGRMYLDHLAYFSQVRPFNALVCHAIYLGPVALVGLFFFRSVVRVALDHGPGLGLVLALIVAFSIDVESRRILQLLILFVPLVVKAIDERGLAYPFGWWLLGGSILYSKFWLKLNVGDPERMAYAFTDRYFWTQGPWMSNAVFAVQAAVVLLTGLFLALLFRSPGKTEVTDPEVEASVADRETDRARRQPRFGLKLR